MYFFFFIFFYDHDGQQGSTTTSKLASSDRTVEPDCVSAPSLPTAGPSFSAGTEEGGVATAVAQSLDLFCSNDEDPFVESDPNLIPPQPTAGSNQPVSVGTSMTQQHEEFLSSSASEQPSTSFQNQNDDDDVYNHATESIDEGSRLSHDKAPQGKKRSSAMMSENIENLDFCEERKRKLIEAVLFFGPPQMGKTVPLRAPKFLFSSEKKVCSIVKNGTTGRIYFICKSFAVNRAMNAIYYCVHQAIAGVRSSIIRELSSLPNSSPDHFLQNFRWIDNNATDNHFFLICLRVLKFYLLGKEMNSVVRGCQSFGVPSLMKEFAIEFDSNVPKKKP